MCFSIRTWPILLPSCWLSAFSFRSSPSNSCSGRGARMLERTRRDWAWIILVGILQILPIVAVAMNSVATEWAGTIFPVGLTDTYYVRMLNDPRFLQAIRNSVLIGIGSTIVTPLI